MGLGSGERGCFVHEFSIEGIGPEHLSDVRGGRCCSGEVGMDHFRQLRVMVRRFLNIIWMVGSGITNRIASAVFIRHSLVNDIRGRPLRTLRLIALLAHLYGNAAIMR